jgi:succinylglutamic semialdehyde dehydrogenase
MLSELHSVDPSTMEILWTGNAATKDECMAASTKARAGFSRWSATPLSTRVETAERFAKLVTENATLLAECIAREVGKPLWEAKTEVASIAAKVGISIKAYRDRTGEREEQATFGRMVLRHRPHGVMLVLGPFNFPGHLPTGHIVPALLAGNSILFKPSEHAPATGEMLVNFWHQARLPNDVLVLVQGDRDTGAALLETDIDGLLFTGSAKAGLYFQKYFADRAGFVLALELGGNNPIIYWDGDIDAAASIIIQSAFISAGQRCSCARRLILPDTDRSDTLIIRLTDLASRLRVGPWKAAPEPFMGSLVSNAAADHAFAAFEQLQADGGTVILAPERPGPTPAFMTPALIDMSAATRRDDEIFGPVLQIIRVEDFDAAIEEANRTAYGLSAALLTEDDALWDDFLLRARAGVINRNRPSNGAASSMPFGGLGASGNHRPSAYYAADYCAYPVASAESPTAQSMMATITPYLKN